MLFASKKKQTVCVAICITEEGVSVVGLNADNALLFNDYVTMEANDETTLKNVLTGLVKRHDLSNYPCTLILDPLQYQLLMTDKLNVPDDEMANALKWRVKGLLDYPADDVVLDVFLVPPHGTGEQRKKAFVVASSESQLLKRVQLFERNLISLERIDVSELAERNIVSCFLREKCTAILLSPHAMQCQMTIYYGHEIYLVRRIPLKIDNDGDKAQFESLVLELQRSIDYCISELKLPEPKFVYLSPHLSATETLLPYLSEQLTQSICPLDLNQVVKVKEPLSAKQCQQGWLSFGGAITYRVEKELIADAAG